MNARSIDAINTDCQSGQYEESKCRNTIRRKRRKKKRANGGGAFRGEPYPTSPWRGGGNTAASYSATGASAAGCGAGVSPRKAPEVSCL